MVMFVLLMGTLAMIGIMVYSCIKYRFPVWKAIPCALILAALGVLGTKIMAVVEGGSWEGQSFFGAVLFTPVMMCLVAPLFKLKVRDLLDLCAPAECGMLIFQKIACLVTGCCEGRICGYNAAGEAIRFPSQLVECITAVIILCVLLSMIQDGKQRGRLYPWYLVLYGSTRFALNLFRETTPFVWILPAGNFWSIVAVTAGAISLLIYKKHAKTY